MGRVGRAKGPFHVDNRSRDVFLCFLHQPAGDIKVELDRLRLTVGANNLKALWGAHFRHQVAPRA